MLVRVYRNTDAICSSTVPSASQREGIVSIQSELVGCIRRENIDLAAKNSHKARIALGFVSIEPADYESIYRIAPNPNLDVLIIAVNGSANPPTIPIRCPSDHLRKKK